MNRFVMRSQVSPAEIICNEAILYEWCKPEDLRDRLAYCTSALDAVYF